MARKSDIRAGAYLYGPDGYRGVAQGRPQHGDVRVSLFAGDLPLIANRSDVEVGPAPAPRILIKLALDRLVESGRKFTADEVWPMLAIYPHVSSAEHKGCLARLVQIYRDRGDIRSVSWRVTERSAPKSRAVPVWVKVGRARKVAA